MHRIFFLKEEWYFKSSKCPAGGRIENRLKYLRRITAEKDKKQVGVGSPEDIASTSSSEDLASPQMNYGMHLQMLPIISKAYNSLMQPVEFLLVQFNWNSIILFQFPELPVEFLLV